MYHKKIQVWGVYCFIKIPCIFSIIRHNENMKKIKRGLSCFQNGNNCNWR